MHLLQASNNSKSLQGLFFFSSGYFVVSYTNEENLNRFCMHNSVVIDTPVKNTYENFTLLLRKILDSVSDLGYFVQCLGPDTTNLLDENSNLLLSLKTVVSRVRNQGLKLQCTFHLNKAAFKHLDTIKRDLLDRSFIKYDLGYVGIAAWNALIQVLNSVNIAKSVSDTFAAVENFTTRMEFSVLKQDNNELSYIDFYYQASRILIFEISNFFEDDNDLNIFCFVKVDKWQHITYKVVKSGVSQKDPQVKNFITLYETKSYIDATERLDSLFLNAEELMGGIGLDSLMC